MVDVVDFMDVGVAADNSVTLTVLVVVEADILDLVGTVVEVVGGSIIIVVVGTLVEVVVGFDIEAIVVT